MDSDPTNRGLSYSTVDYMTILNKSYANIEESQIDLMISSLPDSIVEINLKGSLSEEFMDNKGIMKNSQGRDALVLHRQYAQILSHPGASGKFHNYLIDRFLATDKTEIRRRKEIARLQGIVRRKEEADNKAMAKRERIALENSLPPEQKRLLQQQKKQATAAKKQATAEKKAEEIRIYLEAKEKLNSGNIQLPEENNQPVVDVIDEDDEEESDEE